MTTPVLEIDGLTIRFGGVTALDDVSFAVDAGSLTALIGPNGAGKTSLFNCISGIYKPTSGRVRLAGEDITKLPQYKRARRGMARGFPTPALFKGLTVLEDMMARRYRPGPGGGVAGPVGPPPARRAEIRP